MKNNSITRFAFLSCAILLFIVPLVTPSNAAEHVGNWVTDGTEDKSEFEYHRSEKGPGRWGDLSEEWTLCKTGKMQSPIDLSHPVVEIVPTTATIERWYEPAPAVHKNRGHDIMVEWKGKTNKIKINETYYTLLQGHWHTPSEHTIDGQRFNGELHLVHQSEDKKMAVTSVLFKIGMPDPFLTQLIARIKSIADPYDHADAGILDPELINMGRSGYYRYIGSLTTPPCTEGIIWTINKEIATISNDQIALLQNAVLDHAEHNSRPVQALNGRKVYLYTPHYVTLC